MSKFRRKDKLMAVEAGRQLSLALTLFISFPSRHTTFCTQTSLLLSER